MEESFGRPSPLGTRESLPSPGPGDLDPYYVPRPIPRRDRPWLHGLLFILTVITTTIAGGYHYLFFERGFSAPGPAPAAGVPVSTVTEYLVAIVAAIMHDIVFTLKLASDPEFMGRGLWYSLTILTILGCHEMGHYLTCRRYGVDATLPFFLPAPLPLTGTLGAVIRIRSRIPTKKALFDIAFAGPIAGFAIVVPTLFIGLAMSTLERIPENFAGAWLGEPLLFRMAAWLMWGDRGVGMDINLHPMAFAAWFGLLATALNLFPIGQLDGGHIAYAVLGRRSAFVTVAMTALAIGLTFVSASWLIWTILMVIMLLAMGPHHPPTLDEHSTLDRGRVILAVFALVMLIICFTPVPIEFVTGQ